MSLSGLQSSWGAGSGGGSSTATFILTVPDNTTTIISGPTGSIDNIGVVSNLIPYFGPNTLGDRFGLVAINLLVQKDGDNAVPDSGVVYIRLRGTSPSSGVSQSNLLNFDMTTSINFLNNNTTSWSIPVNPILTSIPYDSVSLTVSVSWDEFPADTNLSLTVNTVGVLPVTVGFA